MSSAQFVQTVFLCPERPLALPNSPPPRMFRGFRVRLDAAVQVERTLLTVAPSQPPRDPPGALEQTLVQLPVSPNSLEQMLKAVDDVFLLVGLLMYLFLMQL